MKIIFKQEVFQKFRAYINGIDYEISGFGKIEKVDGNLVVTDIRIFPQIVSAAHTTLDAKALAKFWDGLIVAGEDIGKWKLWWHSHVNMEASFSSIDDDTIAEFDSEMPEENWMLSIVTNKRGDIYPQIDVFEPIRCVLKNVPYDVEVSDKQIETDVAQEIKDNVEIINFRTKFKKKSVTKISFPLIPNLHFLSPQEKIKFLSENPDLLKQDPIIYDN